MITTPFQPQFSWRKLGYLYYTDSLEYRKVLDANPQWGVTELPPLGAQIELPSSYTTGSGGLSQSSFVFGLSAGTEEELIFPYDTTPEYEEALDRYSIYSVLFKDSLNGYSADSESAITGIQQGG
jgi:hypothetical protein